MCSSPERLVARVKAHVKREELGCTIWAENEEEDRPTGLCYWLLASSMSGPETIPI
jgi:hypothetical protein